MDIFKQLSVLEQVRSVIMTPSCIYSGTFYCLCWSVNSTSILQQWILIKYTSLVLKISSLKKEYIIS